MRTNFSQNTYCTYYGVVAKHTTKPSVVSAHSNVIHDICMFPMGKTICCDSHQSHSYSNVRYFYFHFQQFKGTWHTCTCSISFITREITFMTSLLLSYTPNDFWKGVYSKRKEFATHGSKFCPFRVDLFSEGRQTIGERCRPWKVSVPHNNTAVKYIQANKCMH